MAKKRKKITKKIAKSPDVPVTQKQFTAFSTEVRALLTNQQLEMQAMEKRMDGRFVNLEEKFDSRFRDIDSKFQAIDAKFEAMDAKFEAKFQAMDAKFEAKFQAMDAKFEAKFQAMDAKIDSKFLFVDAQFLSLEAKIEKLAALVHRTNVIVEEQNARNIYVLDGLRSVIDVQEDLYGRIKKLEKATFGIES